MVRVYTTAPVDYDGFGTRTVRLAGHTDRGKTVRLVETADEHATWQRLRYQSGMCLAVDESEWRKLVGYGLAVEFVRQEK